MDTTEAYTNGVPVSGLRTSSNVSLMSSRSGGDQASAEQAEPHGTLRSQSSASMRFSVSLDEKGTAAALKRKKKKAKAARDEAIARQKRNNRPVLYQLSTVPVNNREVTHGAAMFKAGLKGMKEKLQLVEAAAHARPLNETDSADRQMEELLGNLQLTSLPNMMKSRAMRPVPEREKPPPDLAVDAQGGVDMNAMRARAMDIALFVESKQQQMEQEEQQWRGLVPGSLSVSESEPVLGVDSGPATTPELHRKRRGPRRRLEGKGLPMWYSSSNPSWIGPGTYHKERSMANSVTVNVNGSASFLSLSREEAYPSMFPVAAEHRAMEERREEARLLDEHNWPTEDHAHRGAGRRTGRRRSYTSYGGASTAGSRVSTTSSQAIEGNRAASRRRKSVTDLFFRGSPQSPGTGIGPPAEAFPMGNESTAGTYSSVASSVGTSSTVSVLYAKFQRHEAMKRQPRDFCMGVRAQCEEYDKSAIPDGGKTPATAPPDGFVSTMQLRQQQHLHTPNDADAPSGDWQQRRLSFNLTQSGPAAEPPGPDGSISTNSPSGGSLVRAKTATAVDAESRRRRSAMQPPTSAPMHSTWNLSSNNSEDFPALSHSTSGPDVGVDVNNSDEGVDELHFARAVTDLGADEALERTWDPDAPVDSLNPETRDQQKRELQECARSGELSDYIRSWKDTEGIYTPSRPRSVSYRSRRLRTLTR